jgi:hypothetical protein
MLFTYISYCIYTHFRLCFSLIVLLFFYYFSIYIMEIYETKRKSTGCEYFNFVKAPRDEHIHNSIRNRQIPLYP